MKTVTYDETQWKLVPKEAVGEMISAFWRELQASTRSPFPPDWVANAIYQGMLEAAPVAAQPSVPRSQIESALNVVQDVMQDAYQNGHQECCGHGIGGECCGNADVVGDEADRKIMDVLAPVQRALSAMLAAAPTPPAVEQMQQDTSNYVSCGCGDMYPPDSYGAGYIHGAGQCENCEAGQPHAMAIRNAALEEAAHECECRELRVSRKDAQAICRLCAKDIRALKGQVVKQQLTTQPSAQGREDTERLYAIKEGVRNAACDNHFASRGHLDYNIQAAAFNAGFDRGWDAAIDAARKEQP